MTGGGSELEAEIVKLAASQGLWAVLFVALLFYVLKHNEKREERLMTCLEKLTQDVGDIKDDISELKSKICL